jgi:ribosomal 50S subunit-recycling heat shock protein
VALGRPILFKTRRAATEAVVGGRARVNGERVRPSKEIRSADVIEVRVGDAPRTVTVTYRFPTGSGWLATRSLPA